MYRHEKDHRFAYCFSDTSKFTESRLASSLMRMGQETIVVVWLC